MPRSPTKKFGFSEILDQLSAWESLSESDVSDLGPPEQLAALRTKLLGLADRFSTKSSQEMTNHMWKAMDSLPSIVSYLNSNLDYKYVNFAYEKWFGVPQAECLKLNMTDIVGAQGIQTVRKELDAAFSGVEQSFEKEVKFKDGRTRFLQVTYAPHVANTGEVDGVLVIATDLTEQRRASKLLEAERANLQQIINGVPALISHWDKNLINIAANNLYFEGFGKTPEQIVGRHYSELLGPIYDKVLPYIQNALGGKTQTFDYEVTSKEGKLRRMRVTYHPQWQGSQVIGIFTIAIDVTEQHDAAFRFEQMANAIEEVFWMTDPVKQSIVYISPGFEKVWGRTCAELYANLMTFVEAIHPDDRSRVCAAFAKQPLGTYNERYRIQLADGTIKWIHDVAYPIYSSKGTVQWVVGVAKDVSAEVQAAVELDRERLKTIQSAKLASLGEMSAGMAHEINNPLAIIASALPLLKRLAADPEKLASKTEAIQRSVERIAKIVRGLKKFSRTADETVRRPAALADVIRESLVLTEGNIKRNATMITTDLRTTAQVLCDEVELEQVVINLVNNAIDAVKDLPEKWVKITLTEEGAALVLRIVDSGSGIDPEVSKKLFQPFFTTKRVGEGTGLGLSIVKGILDEHGATIALRQDEPNTCFEMRFRKLEEMIDAA